MFCLQKYQLLAHLVICGKQSGLKFSNQVNKNPWYSQTSTSTKWLELSFILFLALHNLIVYCSTSEYLSVEFTYNYFHKGAL